MSSYDKLLEVYNNMCAIIFNSNSILDKAMKYVPISTKAGTELHNAHEANRKQAMRWLSKREGV